jgi:transposase
VEGIEPTNNISERALRPAVIWRKLSFGTQSARGSRFVQGRRTKICSIFCWFPGLCWN